MSFTFRKRFATTLVHGKRGQLPYQYKQRCTLLNPMRAMLRISKNVVNCSCERCCQPTSKAATGISNVANIGKNIAHTNCTPWQKKKRLHKKGQSLSRITSMGIVCRTSWKNQWFVSVSQPMCSCAVFEWTP